ncbi:MAG TPA: hydroxymethylbilane synthase, partial [Candidatus Hydrogenedentes bacterium]|nr:hydroxymethylbilane synthase [Candidatus Hydrogenedentota bacterium]
MSERIVIGSRGSELALRQSEQIAHALRARAPDTDVVIEIIRTTGDKITDVPLAQIGGKGLFTKEIEEALLAGAIDLAVHSMKDLPTELPPGLCLGAVPKRENPRDVLVSSAGLTLDQLPPGARVGTSSLRRAAQLRAFRGDLALLPLRGNVNTRLRKVSEG